MWKPEKYNWFTFLQYCLTLLPSSSSCCAATGHNLIPRQTFHFNSTILDSNIISIWKMIKIFLSDFEIKLLLVLVWQNWFWLFLQPMLEWLFSAVKLIKTFLQNTKTGNRLNHYIIFHAHCRKTNQRITVEVADSMKRHVNKYDPDGSIQFMKGHLTEWTTKERQSVLQ